MDCAASCLQSSVVYGFDENGNEVALAIIIDGPFNSEEEKMKYEIREQVADEEVTWIGGQEECVTLQAVEIKDAERPKHEIKQESEVEEKAKNQESSKSVVKKSEVIKKYRFGLKKKNTEGDQGQVGPEEKNDESQRASCRGKLQGKERR